MKIFNIKTNKAFTPTPILVSLRRVSGGIIIWFKKTNKEKFPRLSFNKKIPVLVSGFTPTPMIISFKRIFKSSFSGLGSNRYMNIFKSPVKKQYHHWCRGFTLIETLVAISILLLSIISPLILAKQGVASARLAKNQIIAFYLAQEAVEYVRNVRDSNLIQDVGWLNHLTDCRTGQCYITTNEPNFDTAINSCGAGGCPELNKKLDGYTEDSFYYTYEDGDASGFTRVIEISDVNSEEISVEVTIFWDRGNRSFSVKENLYNLR